MNDIAASPPGDRKHSTPVLNAVRRMHADDDSTAPKGADRASGPRSGDPYNTVRRPDVIEWTPEPPTAARAENVTMWTDENGLDCYETTLEGTL